MTGIGAWLRGLFATKQSPDPGGPLSHLSARYGAPESLVGNNDFALAMYGQLRQPPANLFFSPFSLRVALGMIQAGARGETAAQMTRALRMSPSDETLHVGFIGIIQRLNAAGGDKYEVTMANALWCQAGAAIQAEFLGLIRRHYGGAMDILDFRRSAEAARATMNQWVENKTMRRIRELIPSGSVNAETRLVLVNAVYFKGTWVMPFPRMATRDTPFRLEDGGTVQTSLMHQRSEVWYMQGTGYQAVDLVYRGDDLSMLVLLPDRDDGLQDLETKLSARTLDECVARMTFREVKLFLPRFKMTWGTVNLCGELKTLGMPLAFSRTQADFSGINGHEPPDEDALFVSAVFHKAFADVNEEGTEAAAASALGMTMASALAPPSRALPVPIFRADHPFLFAIRDRGSGAILFLGRVADPTLES